MRATLVGSAGPLIGREFSLDKPVVTIGRRDENDVVIKDPTVSRNHARIRQEGGELILTDNGSTSGTVVNGAPLTGEHRLRDGDTIVIGGNATFTVQLQPDDEGATIAFSRDQLPGLLPQGEPSDPGLRAARENYREAGQTSVIPTIDLGANEPPAPSAAQAAPAERAPEPPAMGGGYGERAAFPSPPPAQPQTPQYDREATNVMPPPPARDAAPAAGGWAPPASSTPPPASAPRGGVDLGGDTVSWPAPPRDERPAGSGWALPSEQSQPPTPTPAGFDSPPSMTAPQAGYGAPPPDPAMSGPAPSTPYPASPGYATPPPPAAAPAAGVPSAPTAPSAAPAARGSRRGLVIGIVIVLIILIALFVALTFFLVRRFVGSSASLPPDALGLAVQAVVALATS